MRDLMVAAAQIAPVLGQLDGNLEMHLHYIDEAKKQKVDVIVFPELSLTGYELQEEDALKIARQYNSKEVLTIAKASKGITAIFGMVELGFAAQLHNTSLAVRDNKVFFSKIFGPHGEVLAEASQDEETLIFAQLKLKYNEIVKARACLPTVRDSNLDLIHRETVRLWNSIGRPTFVES